MIPNFASLSINNLQISGETFSYIDKNVTTLIVFDITIFLTYWYTGKNSNLKREDLDLEDQRISIADEDKIVDFKHLEKNYSEP